MAIKLSPISFQGHKPKQGGTHPSREEYIRLVNLYQDTTDKQEKKRIADKILVGTETLVLGIAHQMANKLKATPDELAQAGRWGVFRAIRAWKRDIAEEKKASFTTYATLWIRAEMYRFGRKEKRGIVPGPLSSQPEELRKNPAYQIPIFFIPWDQTDYFSKDGGTSDVLAGDMACLHRGIEQEKTSRQAELRVLRDILSKEISEVLQPRDIDVVLSKLSGEEIAEIGKRQGRTRQATHQAWLRSLDKLRKHFSLKYPALKHE